MRVGGGAGGCLATINVQNGRKKDRVFRDDSDTNLIHVYAFVRFPCLFCVSCSSATKSFPGLLS